MVVFRGLFSFLHQTGCRIKNRLYAWGIKRSARSPIPVISVGNISFGGTEKTPLSIEILSWLLGLGLRPALISRGYKGRWERSGGVVSAGEGPLAGWREAGDEPALIARKLPGAGVFVGKRRIDSCRKAREMGFQVAVLDDGFQHRRLRRDLDIVLINPSEIPALREPLSSLKRADLILVRNGPRAGRVEKSLIPEKVLPYRVRLDGFVGPDGKDAGPGDRFKGKKVMAFCGIAKPERFFNLLEDSGAHILGRFAFPDHFPYPQPARKKLLAAFQESGVESAVTTEKDAVKLDPPGELQAGFPVFALKIKIEIEDAFFERVRTALKPYFPDI
jgi:tetraacyldisaccharide 4'-kinase